MTSMKEWSKAKTHAIWDPWLGSQYAQRLEPARLRYWYSYLFFCAGLVVFYISLLFAGSFLAVSVVGCFIALLGCVVLALGGRGLEREGHRLADVLRRTGVVVDRRAPLHNIAFFGKWVRRNHLSQAQLLNIVSGSLNPGSRKDQEK